MFVFFMQPTSESINFEKGNENKRKMIQSDVQWKQKKKKPKMEWRIETNCLSNGDETK